MTPAELLKKSISQKWQVFLEKSAELLFPTYYHKVTPLKQSFQGFIVNVGQDIISNTPLQILTFYTFLLYPFMTFGGIIIIFWKVEAFM